MDAGEQNTINLKIDALLNHRVGSVAPLHHPGVYSDRNILSRGIVEILKTDGDRNCVLFPILLPAYSALAEPIKGNSYYIWTSGN